ncbi:helix-turn-helix domain-containing protein [Staphylococcus warneri]|uniref:helix-turn-helix domain-containing protein n=1 Tax=Staphylococcus warneri TaxID=1292 RepID=UPI001F42842D|nr:helix-turn-helix transcriptional regulator [Staphylococcus warneri]
MTYSEVSESIYVDRAYISQLATGKRYVSERMRRILMDYFNVELDELFERIEITQVNKHKAIPELTLNKSEIEDLLKTGIKQIQFGGNKLNIKVVN